MKKIIFIFIIIGLLLTANQILAQVEIEASMNINKSDLEDQVINSFTLVLIIGLIAGLIMIVLGILNLKKWNTKLMTSGENPELVKKASSKKTRFIILIIVGVFLTFFSTTYLLFIFWFTS